jgi:hypothetical protein
MYFILKSTERRCGSRLTACSEKAETHARFID